MGVCDFEMRRYVGQRFESGEAQTRASSAWRPLSKHGLGPHSLTHNSHKLGLLDDTITLATVIK